MATTAIDSLRGILNGFRDLNSKGIYTMNATETDLLRQILIEVQALSIGGGIADGSVTTPKIADLNVTTAKLADDSVATAKIVNANVTPAKLSQPLTRSAAIVTSGAVSYDVTGIPSWATEIQIAFSAISTNGVNEPLLQIGDSGGIETSGYLGGSVLTYDGVTVANNNTAGFFMVGGNASTVVLHGVALFTLVDSSTNTWALLSVAARSDAPRHNFSGGAKSLSGVLDRIRLTTNSADTFDGGSFVVSYK